MLIYYGSGSDGEFTMPKLLKSTEMQTDEISYPNSAQNSNKKLKVVQPPSPYGQKSMFALKAKITVDTQTDDSLMNEYMRQKGIQVGIDLAN
jgi:hypothetical protein